jgi:hypothetical protein
VALIQQLLVGQLSQLVVNISRVSQRIPGPRVYKNLPPACSAV